MDKQKELNSINTSTHSIDKAFSRIPIAVLVATTPAGINSNPPKWEVVTKVLYSEEDLQQELDTKLHNYVIVHRVVPNSKFYTTGELVGIRNAYREKKQREKYEELKKKFETHE